VMMMMMMIIIIIIIIIIIAEGDNTFNTIILFMFHEKRFHYNAMERPQVANKRELDGEKMRIY
jgi:hypothetical protein